MRTRWLLLAVMLSLNSMACGDWFLPPAGAVRIQPTTVIRAAEAWVDSCAAILPAVRRFADAEWYVVPGGEFQVDGLTAAGYSRGNRIYLAGAYVLSTAITAHEYLHFSRGLPGRTATDHPPIFWRCHLDPRQI